MRYIKQRLSTASGNRTNMISMDLPSYKDDTCVCDDGLKIIAADI